MIRLTSFIESADSGSFSGSYNGLTVRSVIGNRGEVSSSVSNVTVINFDTNSGFNVTDNSNGEVFVDLGSSFADIFVEGHETLEAKGEDALEFIAGEGIRISTTTEHTGSAPKAIRLSTIGFGVLVIDASDDSPQLPVFQDLLDNPCNYKGRVVYLTNVGPTPRPDPFLWADKFYFNEGCEWYESPFALGRLLDE